MAKRKRLTPALLGPAPGFEINPDSADSIEIQGAAPEVKSMLRLLGMQPAPPIARVAADAATQAALAELSGAMTAAREEGRLVLRLPLADVDAGHLVRDRITLDEEELEGLVASIREHGQRTPVEVTEIASGRYGLISGWRRIQALHRLFSTLGEDRFGYVLALVRRPETAADAYVAMVEENEIRASLSYYERARIAGRAVELGVFETEKQALQRLFSNASRARRSKIGSFLTIWRHLDPVLRFPAAIPERLGLVLEKAVETANPALLETFLVEMREKPAANAAAEQARLQAFAAVKPDDGASGLGAPGSAPGSRRLDPVSHEKQVGAVVAPNPDTPHVPQRQEVRTGVFLEISGGFTRPVLTLSGPGVDPNFRERLEHWLATGQ